MKRTVRSIRGIVTFSCILTALPLVSGCSGMGALGYFLGWGRDVKVEPQYELPEGTLLVLVDDPRELVHLPQTRELLSRHVAEELIAHEAVDSVVSPESVSRLRRLDSNFEKHSAHELGRKLNADTVLWLEVRDFFAPQEIQDTSAAAKLTVTVKVLNAAEESRASQVRLWPVGGEGHIVETELRAVDVDRIEDEQSGVPKALARRTAVQIARLFYQHTLGDIDDDRLR